MPSFSHVSTERLLSCHPDLVRLFQRVVEDFDCSIIDGHRGEERQDLYYDSGASQLRWPDSKHNTFPSLAVDAAPYPVNWDDVDRFHLFAGFVLGIASEMGVVVVWGGDWNNDTEVRDERFRDLAHFELADRVAEARVAIPA